MTASDIIRKMGLFGIGVIALTQEKLEEFTQEMVSKGEMNREEGKKFVSEVLSEKQKQIDEIGEKVGQKVKDVIEKSGIATKNDVKDSINDLNERMEKIEQSIERLKQI